MSSGAQDHLALLASAWFNGTPVPTLDQLGGLPFLMDESAELLQRDDLPALVGVVCADDAAVENPNGREFLLTAAQVPPDALQMEEVAAAFLAQPRALRTLGDDLADVWLETSRTHGDLLGGVALESCARVVLAGAAQEYGLLDRLRRLGRDLDRLDEDYAARLVRVIGALAEHYKAPHLSELLKRLIQRVDVAEDAAFELGMLALRTGLAASDAQDARASLLDARRHFTDAYLDEERPDAAAFAAAVDALLAYTANIAVPADLSDTLRNAVLEIRLNLLRTPPGWRTPRIETLDAWQQLLDTLTRAQAADDPRAWLHAGAIVNDLVTIYTAHRSLDLLAGSQATDTPTSGLHSLVAPRVHRTLLTREGGLAILDQWLEELSSQPTTDQDPTTALVREQAAALRRALTERGDDPPPKPERPAASLAGLGLTAPYTERLERLVAQEPELAARLTAMSEARLARVVLDDAPVVASVYRETQQDLQEQCPDGYVGQFAADIDRMLLLLLRFLTLRLSETQRFGGDARAYLRQLKAGDDRPLEAELGKDLRDFLGGQGLSVYLEVSNIGGGRVDILWQPHHEPITLELKRDWTNSSWDAYASTYLPQAISYQVAGRPINFLVVLDLTDKPFGLAAVPACVEVRRLPGPAGDPRPRTAIMVRIQGNKRNPSDI